MHPPPAVSARLAQCTAGQPAAIVAEAWRAQQRLHRRYRHLVGHGKRPTVAVTAVARELAGFVWAAMTRTPPGMAAEPFAHELPGGWRRRGDAGPIGEPSLELCGAPPLGVAGSPLYPRQFTKGEREEQ